MRGCPISLLAVSAVCVPATNAAAAQVKPVWQVVRLPASCGLRTVVTSAGQSFEVLLRSAPARDYWWLEIAGEQPNRARWGTASLTSEAGQRSTRFFVEDDGRPRPVTRLKLDEKLLAWMRAGSGLAIIAGSFRVRIPKQPDENGFSIVDRCKAELLEQWGATPSTMAEAATPPKVDLSKVENSMHYPADALLSRREGDADAVLVVVAQNVAWRMP